MDALTYLKLLTPATPGADGTIAPASVRGFQGVLLPHGLAAAACVVVVMPDGTPAGFGGSPLLSDNVDTVAPVVAPTFSGVLNRATLYNSGGNTWNRAGGTSDDSDAQSASAVARAAITAARLQAFNGTTFDRLRIGNASRLAAQTTAGGLVTVDPGEWSIFNAPAAGVRALTSRPAGGVGVRHVVRGLCVQLVTGGNVQSTIVQAVIRDGATGVGPILWTSSFRVNTANTVETIALSDMNIVGSANTEMVLEFTAAPVALASESVTLVGYDAL